MNQLGKIHKLSPALADMIAAGEVVERPASVIKELVENAVDAGARKITVEIRDGGITYMRVTDDGCGMSAEDAATAFLRHATSKISCAEDLGGIATMGFRGEALAAISAVSKVDLLTCAAGDALGTSIRVEAGNVLSAEPAGCPTGTTMIIRELFYNTPARMKFLKRDSVEGSYISGAVQRQALGHPEIAFRLIRDGKVELTTPGDGQLISAIYAVMGRSCAKEMVEVKSTGSGITVTGFVGKPTASRGSRSYQHFFVNGRYVKSRMMMSALEEAYKNQIMVGRFPICVLHVEVAPTAVDVNVHPAKTEVKFLREGDVFDAIHYGVLGTLSRTGGRPEMTLEQTRPAPKQDFFKTVTAAEYRSILAGDDKKAASPPAPGKQPEKPAASINAPVPRQEAPRPAQRIKEVRDTIVPPAASGRQTAQGQPAVISRGEGDRQVATDYGGFLIHSVNRESPAGNGIPQRPTPARAPVSVSVDDDWARREDTVTAPDSGPEQTAMELPPMPQPKAPEAPKVEIPKKEAELPYKIIGQALDTYIIVEQGEGLLLFDKHAAHERILFERLKAKKHEIMSQTLLSPMQAELSREEMAALMEHRDTMDALGFSLEDFGNGILLVRAIPCDVAQEDAESCLAEIAQQLLDGHKPDRDAVFDELLHTVACKAAIKGGRKTDPRELEALVAELMSRDDIKYCPHGRPVCISLSKKTLEKQFKRT